MNLVLVLFFLFFLCVAIVEGFVVSQFKFKVE